LDDRIVEVGNRDWTKFQNSHDVKPMYYQESVSHIQSVENEAGGMMRRATQNCGLFPHIQKLRIDSECRQETVNHNRDIGNKIVIQIARIPDYI
jgi:hypothetical protein